MTALTVYCTNTVGSTLSTTYQLSVTHGTDNVSVTQDYTLIGTATGWGEIYAKGNTAAWAAAGAIGSPSGNGFMLESATLNLAGDTIAAGSWSANVRLATGHTDGTLSGAVGSATLHVRIYKYHSGTYTQIIDLSLSGQTINSTITTFALSGSTGSGTNFNSGDLLYVDIWANIGTSGSGDAALNFRLNRLSTNNTGDSNAEVVTPGYSPTSGALAATFAGVGTLSGTLSAKTALAATLSGVGTLTLRSVLSAALAGTGQLLASLAVPAGPSSSIVSLFYQKIQLVQVFDPFGQYLTIWRDAPHISGLKDTINCAQGQIKMVLPRTIESFGAPGQNQADGSVALMNQVKIFLFGPGLPQTGLLKFSGFIDSIEPAVTDTQQQAVTVTLTPWSAVFGDHGYGGSQQFTNVDPLALFKYWFDTTDSITGVTYTDPMTWAASNPTSSGKMVSYLIQGLDLKSIADTAMTMLGSGWFWRPNPDKTVTIGQVPGTAQHLFQLGRHFASMSYSTDNTQRKNVIYVVGSSQSVKAVAVGSSAKPPSQGGIGERLLQVQDSRLTDVGSCQVVADALLSTHDAAQVRAKFRVVDYRGSTGGTLGYDIEKIKVGDAISIADARGHTFPSTWGSALWGSARWGQSAGAIFNQVVPIASIDYNWSYVDVEAGILAPSQDRRLFALQRKFSDFTLGL